MQPSDNSPTPDPNRENLFYDAHPSTSSSPVGTPDDVSKHIDLPPSQAAALPTSTHPLVGNGPVPKLQPFRPGTVGSSIARPPAQAVTRPNYSNYAAPPAPASPQDQPFGAPEKPPLAQPLGAAQESTELAPQTPASPSSQQWFQPASGAVGQPDYSPAQAYFGSTGDYQPKKRRFVRTPLLLSGVAVLVVLIGGGYVFGMYLPNKPENVYKTGLGRTGKAVDALLSAGTEKTKLDTIKKGTEVSGSVVVQGPNNNRYSGTFSSNSDDKHSNSNLTYSPDKTTEDFKAQVLTELADGQPYPNLYFKLTGLSAIGGDQIAPQLAQYDGKWINVSPSYIESLIPADPDTAQDANNSLTPEDVTELSRAVITTTREYVFTNDPTKNVLVQNSFKGTETVDGQAAYRYEMGLNKQHSKDFCKAIITNVMATKAYKHIPGVPHDNLAETQKSAITGCQQEIDTNLKDSDTFDMWVSKKTKLISKVRFTDDNQKGTYVDIGQNYTGGSNLPMYTAYHNDAEHYNVKVSLNADLDTNTTKASVAVDTGQGKDTWSVHVNMTFKPNKNSVTYTKPADSVSIEQVLQTLSISPAAGAADPLADLSVYGGVQSKAKDTERQTDLRALQGQLEAYYAQNGVYPLLSQINTAAWRAQNMRGLDDQALADPDGKKVQLFAAASTGQYGYTASGCDNSGCLDYTLTVLLSMNAPFTLQSLNSSVF
jgi:hypothetical protein